MLSQKGCIQLFLLLYLPMMGITLCTPDKNMWILLSIFTLLFIGPAVNPIQMKTNKVGIYLFQSVFNSE